MPGGAVLAAGKLPIGRSTAVPQPRTTECRANNVSGRSGRRTPGNDSAATSADIDSTICSGTMAGSRIYMSDL